MDAKHIAKGIEYPKYNLVRHAGALHVCLESGECPADFSVGSVGYFSVGEIGDAENFETACDNAEEDFRCMAAEFGM